MKKNLCIINLYIMNILVTGGCGYIGSHICVELLNMDYNVIVVDNKNNIVENINAITDNKKIIRKFYKFDLTIKKKVQQIFEENTINCVIHLAGYKAVKESVINPLKYYHNNLISSINLLEVMKEHNCTKFIFSSSACVYGMPKILPIKENCETKAINPYGKTKLMIEKILYDLYLSDKSWNIINLRYFNPIGSHPSKKINEKTDDIPNNLLPYIIKVINKELPYLNIFGKDYDTVDGTAVRDYIHVVDLAKGHLKALAYIDNNKKEGCYQVYNLGTGKGYSVLQMIANLEKYLGEKIPYKFSTRREGDAPSVYTDNHKAYKELKWSPQYDLDMMCENIIDNL